MATKKQAQKPKLYIRNARETDVPDILSLSKKVYGEALSCTEGQLRGQISAFPEGQFVAIFDEKLVGYCASFRISGDIALKPHTWKEITGTGYASRHEEDGEYLYGMEIFVDSDYRGFRIGQRLYNERKKLCRALKLTGIVFGGRIPNYSKKAKEVKDHWDYVEKVKQRKIKDPVLSFHLRNGFQVLGLLKDYILLDHESGGYAVHLLWENPQVEKSKKWRGGLRETLPTVRVAVVQYKQRGLKDFKEFQTHVEYFVDVVADYKADFAVFPEWFTLQLLSVENKRLQPAQAIESLTKYTDEFKSFMSELAIKKNINIIGGSHPTVDAKGGIHNTCFVFLRDGRIHTQDKIHPTPNEKYWWNIQGSNEANTIQTDCGPIGVLICYDSEFPELARHLVDQGAKILFVPFCTDERQSYLRVRYCNQARAVENQCYVALAGNVGNLPGVNNMDVQYAQSCILTPCDFPFARDGVAADTTPNVETIAIADLNLENLVTARNSGTVQNLKDRRFDLYHVSWQVSQKD